MQVLLGAPEAAAQLLSQTSGTRYDPKPDVLVNCEHRNMQAGVMSFLL